MPIFRGKQFVSAVTDYKDSVRVALRTPLTLANTVTIIDGVTLNDKDRVLLAGQRPATTNGIYSWSSSTSRLTRSIDADTGIELTSGAKVYVEEGTANEKTTWILITSGPVVIGSSSIIFAKESRIGPVDLSGTYGASTKTLTITLDESGQLDSIAQSDIALDGGEF